MAISTRDRFLGCFFGLAIGDALGYPVEFMDNEEIEGVIGNKGVVGFDSLDNKAIASQIKQPIGAYSDDTQMSLATANALIRTKTDSTEDFMEQIIKEYITWANSPENNRFPGITCMEGIANLEIGIHWRYSGKDRKGCGAAMRTAPIGLYSGKDVIKATNLAYAASKCTHRNKTAISSGITTALLVNAAMQGKTPKEIFQLTQSPFITQANEEFNDKIKSIVPLLTLEAKIGLSQIGSGWTGHEAVAMALYCFLKSPDNYQQTVLAGVNITGDSDSVASIAGAISGAYNGIQAIPQEWMERIENKDLLKNTAIALYEKAKINNLIQDIY